MTSDLARKESECECTSEEYIEDSDNDGSTDNEDTLDRKEDLGTLTTVLPGVHTTCHCTSKSTSQSNLPSKIAPVSSFVLVHVTLIVDTVTLMAK